MIFSMISKSKLNSIKEYFLLLFLIEEIKVHFFGETFFLRKKLEFIKNNFPFLQDIYSKVL